MMEYKIGNATVRIHGTVDKEKIKTATELFVKRAMAAKRKKAREKQHD